MKLLIRVDIKAAQINNHPSLTQHSCYSPAVRGIKIQQSAAPQVLNPTKAGHRPAKQGK